MDLLRTSMVWTFAREIFQLFLESGATKYSIEPLFEGTLWRHNG